MPRPGRSDLALVGLTLALKVVLLAGGVLAVWATDGYRPGLLEPWDRWDAPHYTDLAVFGYRATDPGNLQADGYEQEYPGDLDLYVVFYPLFPALVAAARWVLDDPVLAAFVVSGAASLFVAPLLRRIVAADLGDARGMRAAVFLLIFPTAYFLHIGYTESLFLALAMGSFWCGRTNRWWAAGMLGVLAALTRVNGLVLIPALALEAWSAWRADPQRRWRWRWLAVGGPLIGFAGYLALNLLVYGDPLAFAGIQREHWFKALSAPWVGIAGTFRWIRGPDLDDALMLGWMELAFLALGLVGTAYSAFRFRPSWTAWMAGNWLLFASTGFVLSAPRYTLALFPLMAWFAVLADRRWVGIGLALASVALLGWFAFRFATGIWAF
jgi:Gpi18-like mannosyltransferase